MNSFTPQTTVGEIAAGMPLTARIFEQLGIDFCCGGQAALSEACAERGLDPAAVMERIRQAGAPAGDAASDADWLQAPLGLLIDHILTAHHAYLKAQLPRLSGMLQKIVETHGERHGGALRPVEQIFSRMRAELEAHMMKEEMILFPLIRRIEEGGGQNPGFHCGSVRNPIRVMTTEHDSAGEALARLRELTAGYTAPEDACNTYRACFAELAALERDLHLHIHLENNILFPRAVELEEVR